MVTDRKTDVDTAYMALNEARALTRKALHAYREAYPEDTDTLADIHNALTALGDACGDTKYAQSQTD